MIAALLRLTGILLALALCAGAALFVYSSLGSGFVSGRLLPNGWDAPVSASPEPVQVFTVRPGQSAAAVGEELQQRGIIRSAMAFRWEVETRGIGNRIEAGDYELSPSMSTPQVAEVLGRGPISRGIVLTIPEGWRAEQVALRVEELQIGRADEVLAMVRGPREHGLVPPDQAAGALEGYLFPETYQLEPRTSSRQVLETMVRQFEKRLSEQVRRKASERGLSLHQLVTLASIVEREAALPAERPIIASVYLNRLAAGMKLDADPTVQYAVANVDINAARAYGFWKNDLTVEDLHIDSPYNTYVRPGLPPGPICSPGIASLEAVAGAADTAYLYFVARGDGSHVFADTFQEHQANVAKYR